MPVPRWLDELLSRPDRALRERPPRPLSLDEYRALVMDGGRPTDAQCSDFVNDVSTAHSWYKHLPSNPPGQPFMIFFDPQAGRVVMWEKDGRARIIDRPEGEEFFHYNEKPTTTYRSRFGWLAYHAEAGTQVMLLQGGSFKGDHRPNAPIVFSDEGEPLWIPDEVLNAGTAEITGWIHWWSVQHWFWNMERSKTLESVRWPEESVPAAAFARLREICGEMDEIVRREPRPGLEEYTRRTEAFFAKVDEIVQPERERQRLLLLAAVHRVREVVFG